MTRGQRLAPLTPTQRRAHETAEAILDGSGLRYQSGQIPGLAQILMAFAEHEIQLRQRDETVREPTSAERREP